MHTIVLTLIIGQCLNYLLRGARRLLSESAFLRLVDRLDCYPYMVELGTDRPLQIYIPTQADIDAMDDLYI
jgi:hypothetical protein